MLSDTHFNPHLEAISQQVKTSADIHCIISGSTALDLSLSNKWYRAPSDIDLIFYNSRSDKKIDRSEQMKIYGLLKETAQKHGQTLRVSHTASFHPAEHNAANRENFATHRIFFHNEESTYPDAQVDYHMMNWVSPFLTTVAFEHEAKHVEMQADIPQKTLAYKLARHLTQIRQGIHDIYDISQTLHHHDLVKPSDPYQCELLRFHFLLYFACNGLTDESIKLERLSGSEANLKDTYQASKTKLLGITGIELKDVLQIVNTLMVEPMQVENIKSVGKRGFFSGAETHYLEQLRKGINNPEILRPDYPQIFASHPDITHKLQEHPMIINMMPLARESFPIKNRNI